MRWSCVLLSLWPRVHLAALREWRDGSKPHDVAACSSRRIMRYLVTLLSTWLVFVMGVFFLRLTGTSLTHSPKWWLHLRDQFTSLNGALNAFAYAGANCGTLWTLHTSHLWSLRARADGMASCTWSLQQGHGAHWHGSLRPRTIAQGSPGVRAVLAAVQSRSRTRRSHGAVVLSPDVVRFRHGRRSNAGFGPCWASRPTCCSRRR